MSGLTLRITRKIMSSGETQVSTRMRQRRMYLRQSFQGFLAAEQALQKTSFRVGVREAPREACPAELSPALNGTETSVILKTRHSGNWEIKSQDISTTNWWNWQPQDYNWNLGMNLCKCLHELLLQIPAVHLIALGLSRLWRLSSWTKPYGSVIFAREWSSKEDGFGMICLLKQKAQIREFEVHQ